MHLCPREVHVALRNTYGVAAPSISQAKSTGMPTGGLSAGTAPTLLHYKYYHDKEEGGADAPPGRLADHPL